MIQSSYEFTWRLILFSIFLAGLGACSLTKVGRQTEVVDNLSTLEGAVRTEVDQVGPVHVLLFRHNGMSLEKVAQQPV